LSIGPFQILIIALVLLVLFGRGRIGETVGDLGKGMKRFREGLADVEPQQIGARAEAGPFERAADTDTFVG
jgi:sec-independent protein translocase protein TatA